MTPTGLFFLLAGWVATTTRQEHALGSHRHSGAVVEAAHHLAFRTLLELIGGQVQTRLDERMIEHGVLFATGHKGEASQIGKHSPRAILAIEPEQGRALRELVTP